MAHDMATGWYYQKSGGPGQSTGPLTWEQLYAARSSGTLQTGDLVWHASLPQWMPAGQIPNLFAAATQPAASAAAPYQQAPYQPGPYQATPYQQMPGQAPPYQQAGAPAWAGQPGYQPAPRKKTSVAAWLIPLVVLVLVGAGLGVYFGIFYNKADAVDAADLEGSWEGTLRYTSIEVDDPTEEDLAIREATLDVDIPATLEITLDDGVSSTGSAARTATRTRAGDDKGAVTGRAVLTMDLSDIVEEAGTVTNEMTFTYSGNKLVFESVDPTDGEESVTAGVARKGDKLLIEGEMTFEDDTSSAKGVWSMSKDASADGDEDDGDDDGGGDDGGGGDETGVTEGDGDDDGTVVTDEDTDATDDTGALEDDAFAPADLNGSWEGTLTVAYFSGDPWAARGLTYDVLDRISGTPIPVTATITVDESGTGTAQMIVSASAVGAEFDIGTADMPMTTSGMELTFTPESWPWGVPTMTGEVMQLGDSLRISGTFMYESAASVFGAGFNLEKQ